MKVDRLTPSHTGLPKTPWGAREMHVRHPDGHVFRVSQGIEETK
ncbi:MAG TPA: hypothetical protein VNP02_13205 [Gammaproteobacteria bacterium]|jgi:hypothetical protein|nr:hypothetical protein [Gammaproteobacteria bacterium]